MPKTLIDPGPSRRGWHRLQAVLQCPRKYALYTAQKLNPMPTTAPPLIKGTLFHTGLAHKYAIRKAEQQGTSHDFHDPYDAVEEMAKKQPNPTDWAEYITLVQDTMLQYDTHWVGEQWEVMDVERELCAHIKDEERGEVYLYTQRADLVIRNKHSGKWFIVDHKTTFRIAPKTVRRYTLSGQFLGYTMFGHGLLADRFGGVVLNMVQWPTGTKVATFQRVPLEPAPYANRTFKQTILHAERTIRDLEPKHSAPLEWPGAHHEMACWTAYGSCPYLELCQWGC